LALHQTADYKETKAMKRLCWILILIFSVSAAEAFSKEWNGIIPRVSTRADVEKILVSMDSKKLKGNFYKHKKSHVHIHYERKDENDFNKDVVKMITVYPDKIETLSKYIKKIPNFHEDFSKVEIPNKISHINGLAHYINRSEGFQITVHRNYKNEEVITSFVYFAPVLPPNSSSYIIKK
jgi:hypothetical protein